MLYYKWSYFKIPIKKLEIHCVQVGFALAIYQEVERREISTKSQQNPSKILAKSQQNFEVHCVQEGFALAIYQEVERREIETLLAL